MPRMIDWRNQCHAEFADRKNMIAVRRGTSVPNIQALAIINVDAGKMLSVDAFQDQREAWRANKRLE